MKCKIRITKGLEGVFARYQPEVGKIYDADYVLARDKKMPAVAILSMDGKPIVVRKHEFELVED